MTNRNILYLSKPDTFEDRLSVIHKTVKNFSQVFIRFSELDKSLLKVLGDETGRANPHFSVWL